MGLSLLSSIDRQRRMSIASSAVPPRTISRSRRRAPKYARRVKRLEEATEVIDYLPPHLKLFVERTTPRPKFEDDKSWVQGL